MDPRQRQVVQIPVFYMTLGGVSLILSLLGFGPLSSVGFLSSLIVGFAGTVILFSSLGPDESDRRNRTSTTQRGSGVNYFNMVPRPIPQQDETPPTVSGLTPAQKAAQTPRQWLSAGSIGVSLIAASILWIASAYLLFP